ncbi:MAG: putative zinc-binding peptidase [Reyranellaceae bacterium]
MKLFKCQNCHQIIHFENTLCEKCTSRLGFIPEQGVLTALEADGAVWRRLRASREEIFRFCTNADHNACNWLVAAASPDTLCLSCRHNRTIPDLSIDDNVVAWRRMELAKHRLFYSLLKFGLPMPTVAEDPENGLAFDFLAEMPGVKVLTGHDNGVVTIALAEADDAYRESHRVTMGEPYRTLLGHFRHESGHFFWNRLVRDGDRVEEFRAVFGDERRDYGEALQAYYADGAPADWPERFVSTYAAAHPWEDFAETWAHYLHIVDTLEMAASFGMSTHPALARDDILDAAVDFAPYRAETMGQLIETWLPLSVALNCLNRSMGQPDLYPFVLSGPAIDKLAFVHGLVHSA